MSRETRGTANHGPGRPPTGPQTGGTGGRVARHNDSGTVNGPAPARPDAAMPPPATRGYRKNGIFRIDKTHLREYNVYQSNAYIRNAMNRSSRVKPGCRRGASPGSARELRVGATQSKVIPNLAWERNGGTDGVGAGTTGPDSLPLCRYG